MPRRFKVGEKVTYVRKTIGGFYRTISNPLKIGEILTIDSIDEEDNSYSFKEFGGYWLNVDTNFEKVRYLKLKRILKDEN